jgi:hypothetical protein
MSTTTRTVWAHVRWCLAQATFAFGVYLGAYQACIGAERCVVFLVWVNALIHLAYFSDKALNDLAANKKYVIINVRLVWYVDLAMTLFLVAAGWYVTAGAWLFATVIEIAGEGKIAKLREIAQSQEVK